MTTTAMIGVGTMGEAILGGLLKAGRAADSVLVTARRPERAAELTSTYGVAAVSNTEAADQADTVLVLVKPYDVARVLDEISPVLRPGQLVISLAAGVTIADLEAHVPEGVAVARVMPNTPSMVGEGMSIISPGTSCGDEQTAEVTDLMGAVGRTVTVPEKHQDAATAVAGSGPAYMFYIAEAMIEGGVHLGLPRATATELTAQMLYGSAAMVRDTDTHPTVLREQVTSPGGVTAAALRKLDDHGVRAAFLDALEAARDKSAGH